jgi:uncharacterized membrane protein
MDFMYNVFSYSRIIQAVNESKSMFFYWALMFFAVLYLTIILVLLIYMNYFLKNRKYYAEYVVQILRIMILLMYWIFYQPFFESFISIMNCPEGKHYLDPTMTCF